MELADINPYIRYARIHYFFISSQMNSFCYDCRLFYIKNLTGSIKIDEITYEIHSNTAIYLPPGTKYQFNLLNRENALIYVLNFDLVNDYREFSHSLGTANENTFLAQNVLHYELPMEFQEAMVLSDVHLDNYLNRCTQLFLAKDMLYKETAGAFLKLCLLELLKDRSLKIFHSEIIQRVQEYIQTQYQDATLSNKTIAQAFNYHPYHLSKVVRETTGKTLRQYLLWYRLRIAKNYLITTDFDIGTVAWKTGFNSTSYFVKVFREKFGITPQKYRKENQQYEI